MTKLAILCQQASVGDYVTLRLTRGADVSGRIEHLDNSFVLLDLSGSKFTAFEDNLAGWEVHGHTRPNALALDSVDKPSQNESQDQKQATSHPQQPTPTINHQLSKEIGVENGGSISGPDTGLHRQESNDIAQIIAPKITSLLTKVEATYSEVVKRAQLQVPEPDFQFPESEFSSFDVREEVRREWDRARNQFSFALKVKELSRLASVVRQVLEPLAKNHPNSIAIRSLLGRVLIKLDRYPEARKHLGIAATLSNQPTHWLTLASAAQEDFALECYALRKYFSLVSPLETDEAWYRYLSVGNPIDLKGIAQTINTWYTRPNSDSKLKQLLSDSLIYLLLLLKSKPLATQVASSILKSAKQLPSGWESVLENAAPKSEALLTTEKHFAQEEKNLMQTNSVKLVNASRNEHVPHGRIVFFSNQQFGFIDAYGGETFYFRIDSVIDEVLQHALLDGSWRVLPEVEFEVQPSHGHKYNRATHVVRIQDVESLLQRTRYLLQIGRSPQAMALVRRVLSNDPKNPAATQLENDIKEDIKKQLHDRGTGLPRGNGPYARAKRAHLVDRNLESAEALFKQAIREKDRTTSAIMDLASLLQQQGRPNEAITLLTTHQSRRSGNEKSFDNMLATLYQHAGRHDDAITILTRLQSTASQSQKESILKRITLSYFKSAKYESAERALQAILTRNPNDQTALQWIAGLEDARRAGSEAEAEEIIGGLGELAKEGVRLSSLARAAIAHSTLEGVDPAKVRAGTTGSKDVARVEELAKQLGPKRPRDRAAYYLSAAALLERNPGNAGSGRIYDFLRRYFASMADASWIDRKPVDVVRSYYIESLALVSDSNLYEAWHSLLRYLLTFSPGRPEEFESALPKRSRGRMPRQESINALCNTLEMLDSKTDEGLLEGLIVVGSQSSFARNCLGDVIAKSRTLQVAFKDHLGTSAREEESLLEAWQTRCREQDRIHRRRLSVCRTLTKYQATAADMESLHAQIRSAMSERSSEADRRRLNSIADIVESALTFCQASDFEAKERNYWLVTTQVDNFRKEVNAAPTQYSHEGLLPTAEHLRSLIEEEYAQKVRTSGAELRLRLLVEGYLLGQNGELRLQIEVSNKSGCSPASSVRICLGPGDSEYFAATFWEREIVSILRGGSTEVTQMVVIPKKAALRDQAFPINVTAIYQNSLGEEMRTDEQAWTVRLYPDEDFQYVSNPYSPFAEGGPVDKPEMFVGRDEMLDRLEGSLLSGSGSKSIVMFGQKRAGKSSLLEHLRRRLMRDDSVIPVCLSLQDVAPELSVQALLQRILLGIADVLEELRFDGRDVPEFIAPSVDSLETLATLKFHRSISSLVRAMRRHSAKLKIVLLVDEFTDIFKEIKKGRVPREFMKAWKAIIEKKYFASVLVGQDIMPAFKAEFPNEFGVTEDERVTYLDESSAEMLIQRPIGEDRFAGRAVQRLLDLTACSPYYTMMFCARLVDYMNITRSVIVTEADIRAVEEDMLRGDRRLTRDKFDNLLLAGDTALDSNIEPEDTYKVCVAIARGTESDVWYSRKLIRDSFVSSLDGLLEDLETRDVVERKGDAYRLRVGLFRDWLRLQG